MENDPTRKLKGFYDEELQGSTSDFVPLYTSIRPTLSKKRQKGSPSTESGKRCQYQGRLGKKFPKRRFSTLSRHSFRSSNLLHRYGDELFKGKRQDYFCDCNFKTCPEPFVHIFCIHALIQKNKFPLVWAMIGGNTEGLLSCIQTSIATVKHLGCYFHYTHCIYRKIQNLGLVFL